MARTSVSAQLAKIRKDREALEKKEKELMARSNTRELVRIVAMAKSAGLTADDIVKAMSVPGAAKSTKVARKGTKPGSKSKMAGIKVPPKYRNPDDASQTWTGRGVAPKWAAQLRAAGHLDASLIAPSTPPVA